MIEGFPVRYYSVNNPKNALWLPSDAVGAGEQPAAVQDSAAAEVAVVAVALAALPQYRHLKRVPK